MGGDVVKKRRDSNWLHSEQSTHATRKWDAPWHVNGVRKRRSSRVHDWSMLEAVRQAAINAWERMHGVCGYTHVSVSQYLVWCWTRFHWNRNGKYRIADSFQNTFIKQLNKRTARWQRHKRLQSATPRQGYCPKTTISDSSPIQSICNGNHCKNCYGGDHAHIHEWVPSNTTTK